MKKEHKEQMTEIIILLVFIGWSGVCILVGGLLYGAFFH
jgi:hypothetical protein